MTAAAGDILAEVLTVAVAGEVRVEGAADNRNTAAEESTRTAAAADADAAADSVDSATAPVAEAVDGRIPARPVAAVDTEMALTAAVAAVEGSRIEEETWAAVRCGFG